MIKIKEVKLIEDRDWDELVKEVYGKKYYCLQQQDGCMDRGIIRFSLPITDIDFEGHPELPNRLGIEEMCVDLNTWVSRDDEKKLDNQKYGWELESYWERHFYPNFEAVASNLHTRGYLEDGEYIINIFW